MLPLYTSSCEHVHVNNEANKTKTSFSLLNAKLTWLIYNN